MKLYRLIQGLSGLLIKSLSEIPVPSFLKQIVYEGLGERFFGMKLNEAELPISSYSSFQDLFTRKLKPGLRKSSGSIISPVDGTLRDVGKIENGFLPSIKSLTSEALNEESRDFQNGSYAVFYLSPKDYHRVHAPCSMKLSSIRHIPGMLWPVNNMGLKICPKLYSTNERVVFSFEGDSFKAALIMVGALNVGGIVSTVEGSPVQMLSGEVRKVVKEVKAGDELGYFQFGSAVLFLISKDFTFARIPGSIKMGEDLQSAS